MPRYSKKAGKEVEKAMHERKKGTLKSGRSGKKVTSRKQAIAIDYRKPVKKVQKFPRRKQPGKKVLPVKKQPVKRKPQRKKAGLEEYVNLSGYVYNR
jgi:hypothetical protein